MRKADHLFKNQAESDRSERKTSVVFLGERRKKLKTGLIIYQAR